MKLKLTFCALFAIVSLPSFAQQTEKAALNATDPVEATFAANDSVTARTTETKTVVKVPSKPTFSLSAGTMFGSNGMATYLAPTMYYRLNQKFSLFTGVTYLNGNFSPYRTEGTQPMATKHYLVNVGGAYDVTDKLRISGSVWRDFSNITGQVGAPNSFNRPARYGTEFRATYKVTESLSIHGAVRTSNGNAYPGFNNPNSYNPAGSAFGF